jgi:hypothetical protein
LEWWIANMMTRIAIAASVSTFIAILVFAAVLFNVTKSLPDIKVGMVRKDVEVLLGGPTINTRHIVVDNKHIGHIETYYVALTFEFVEVDVEYNQLETVVGHKCRYKPTSTDLFVQEIISWLR